MTPKQAENCRILAEFLRTDPRVREEGRFDMRSWVGRDWEGDPSLSCGTAACAAGWATTIPHFRAQGLRLTRAGYGLTYVVPWCDRERVFGPEAGEAFSGGNDNDPDYVADLLEEAAGQG